MRSLAKAIVISVGIVGVVATISGIWITVFLILAAAYGDFDAMVAQKGIRYFYPVFNVIAVSCAVCDVLIFVGSVAMLRFRLRWTGLLIGVLIFEIAAFLFTACVMWMFPSVRENVAFATVAASGMSLQYFVLLPLWAPPALWWAKTYLEHIDEGGSRSKEFAT